MDGGRSSARGGYSCAKSRIRPSAAFLMEASWIVDSRGTVPSDNRVPIGTSWLSRSICRATGSSVIRTPSPVMVGRIG